MVYYVITLQSKHFAKGLEHLCILPTKDKNLLQCACFSLLLKHVYSRPLFSNLYIFWYVAVYSILSGLDELVSFFLLPLVKFVNGFILKALYGGMKPNPSKQISEFVFYS